MSRNKTENNIILRPIKESDLQFIVNERNQVMETLRTPYKLNHHQQLDYFEKVLCDRKSNTRYWVGEINSRPIFYGGIENIEWENSRGEISLLVFKGYRGKGYGYKAVKLILDQSFNYINLNIVWGECYFCGNFKFWETVFKNDIAKDIKLKLNISSTILPDRKYYNGQYWPSYYFNIRKE